MEYPEHEKLKKIQKESEACGSFLDWLTGEKGIVLSEYSEDDKLYPAHIGIAKLLGEYFNIDQNKLEKEKLQMLENIREMNA